jgi:predicted nucleic acid-binding protein
MIRAVIDTNLFLSGLLNASGAPAKLILKNTKRFPYKSYQDVRIVKVSKLLKELEKQFLN